MTIMEETFSVAPPLILPLNKHDAFWKQADA